MSKWLVTAHRDWQRLDVAQFQIVAPTRERAIELARQQLAERPSALGRGRVGIDPKAMKNAYAEVERLKGALNSLFFKMQEAEPDEAHPKLFNRYTAAEEVVSAAADDLLAALDFLRT